MGITVYGRRRIRAIERATGERVVHAAGPWATTVDHCHLEWNYEIDEWAPRAWRDRWDCGLRLSSCRTLFGINLHGEPRNFMRGYCSRCHVTFGEPHRHDCEVLLTILSWNSVNPDYWPSPVHRPLWMDHQADLPPRGVGRPGRRR